MSIQGIQKAAQLINTLGQLIPALAEADAQGLNVDRFAQGTLARMGIPQDIHGHASAIATRLATLIADQPLAEAAP